VQSGAAGAYGGRGGYYQHNPDAGTAAPDWAKNVKGISPYIAFDGAAGENSGIRYNNKTLGLGGGGGYGGRGGKGYGDVGYNAPSSLFGIGGGGGGFCGNGGHAGNGYYRGNAGGGLFAGVMYSANFSSNIVLGGAGWLCDSNGSGGAGFLPQRYGNGYSRTLSSVTTNAQPGCVMLQYCQGKTIAEIQDYLIMLPDDRVEV
jgi:hypothetical protein